MHFKLPQFKINLIIRQVKSVHVCLFEWSGFTIALSCHKPGSKEILQYDKQSIREGPRNEKESQHS
jgi:hypothetical protein